MPAGQKSRAGRHLSRWNRGGQTEPPSVWEVLGEECCRGAVPPYETDLKRYTEALEDYRAKRKLWHAAGKPEEGRAKTDYDAAELTFRTIVIKLLHARKARALCFSGGGIRSASFGLGVLQSLAAHSWPPKDPASAPRLLGDIDYLSTVSGGGYLGGWFSAWASRHAEGSAGVIKELASEPDTPWEPEPEPLRNLRKFSNYLNPQLGAFSADTWTLVATVLRNILLNWLVLLPLLAAFLVLPRILFALVEGFPAGSEYSLYLAAVLIAGGVAYMVMDLPSAGDARWPQRRFLLFGLLPVLLSAVALSLYWAWQGDLHSEPGPVSFVLLGIATMAVGVAAGMPYVIWKRHRFNPAWVARGAGFAFVTGAAGGLMSYWMTWRFTNPSTGDLYDDRIYTWLSVPALLGVFALGQALLVATTSTIASDEDREWWSRAMGWMFIATVAYFAFSGIVLVTPTLAGRLPSIQWQSLATATAGFIASGLGLAPATPATQDHRGEEPSTSSAFRSFARFAPKLIMPLFLVLLIGLIATSNQMASDQVTAWMKTPPSWSPFPPVSQPDPIIVETLLMLALAIPALLLSRVIDANKFSLHAMYRARLIRTFLGASNRKRKPNPFTGFDPLDNVHMADLPAKPLHVVNMTLNLVKGENLAWQQRKAESCTATKYHVGSCRLGYQAPEQYAGNATLGGAIAISGAAANPNMGYVSSPLLSMVMMLFNARLGAWLANPGEAGRGCWYKTGPTFSVRPFIDEALGLTNDRNKWVNLSDGGHFENLGIYEMILRRCHTIIAVDGSADPLFHFDDLGNAIRKIRIDMGVPVEFPHGISVAKEISAGSRHCAVGSIRYSAVDGPQAEDGTLIYIKASLTGNEPRDVLNYATQNPTFPHQSTGNQWFSESQFESYRRLGYHVIEDIFQFHDTITSVDQFADMARSYCGIESKQAAGSA